jgi:formylglycine-generating enzyme required for sulfatase activity
VVESTTGKPFVKVISRQLLSDDFDAKRCNTFETHIGRPTPIGVFPGGETLEGLVDMTGNTWDWTSSLFTDYPYDAADGREEVNASSARRVGRGGSWYRDLLFARASSRLDFAPDFRHDLDVGLRLVRAVPAS